MGGKSIIHTIISDTLTSSVDYALNGIPGDYDEIVGYLDVTAASGTTPTLDINFQNTVDGGTVFFTHSSFAQATTTTTERKAFTAPNGIDGQIQITIGGTTPSFTFSLRLECKRNS